LNIHFRAVAAALDDPELPVRVQAALALTELVVLHEDGVLASANPLTLSNILQFELLWLLKLARLFKVRTGLFVRL
jgi:hypothetical protein